MDVASAPLLARVESTAEGKRLGSIAHAVAQAGGRAVLVGGAVRDGLLGESVVKDLDVEVFGLDIDRLHSVLSRFGDVLAIGRSFGVLAIRGLSIDFSLPRKDNKVAPGHKGFDVEFDPMLSFDQASRRRDLTVNSMGIDLATGEFLDPHGGKDDLERRCLQATDPVLFPEDPLRGLRVAQFAARFCMEPTAELIALCSRLDLSELPAERIGEEFRKLLCKGREPSRGLSFLLDAGLLRFFPELAALVGVPQDADWHPEGDVWVHTLMVIDRAAGLRTGAADQDALLMFGALCHDLGKPATTEMVDGRIRSRNHDRRGVEPTRTLLARLAVGHALKARVAAVVEHHLAPALFTNATTENQAGARGYRRLARQLGEVGLSMRDLERVARADHLGRTTSEAIRGEFPAGDVFLARAEQLAVGEKAPVDVVSGRHLMAAGLEPSPRFGEILRRCRELQDASGSTDADEILDRALREMTPRGTEDR
jgi:tRNA nucleotidyltransferase (CCA-adding enzyme)